MNAPDPGRFWRTIGQRATGATVVTAADGNGPAGFLGLSATHVDADPPTMLVTVGRSTGALAPMLVSRHFAISFLPQEAGELVDIFGGRSELKGTDRFRDGEWTTLATGAPVHGGALGAFDCRLDEAIERPGCLILIGTVVASAMREDGEPLVLFRNRPGTFVG